MDSSDDILDIYLDMSLTTLPMPQPRIINVWGPSQGSRRGSVMLGLSPNSPYLPQPLTEASHLRPSAGGHISSSREASLAQPSTKHRIPTSHFAAESESAATVVLPFGGNRGLLKGMAVRGTQLPHLTNIDFPDVWTQLSPGGYPPPIINPSLRTQQS